MQILIPTILDFVFLTSYQMISTLLAHRLPKALRSKDKILQLFCRSEHSRMGRAKKTSQEMHCTAPEKIGRIWISGRKEEV